MVGDIVSVIPGCTQMHVYSFLVSLKMDIKAYICATGKEALGKYLLIVALEYIRNFYVIEGGKKSEFPNEHRILGRIGD